MILFADSALTDVVQSINEGQSYNYWGEFVNMLLTLGFIIILIFVSIAVLKRIMRSRVSHLNRSTGIKILEKRMLNQKSSLYLVDILGKGIVISESPAGIHIVTEFPQDTSIELLLEQMQEEQKPKESFAQRLKKLASKRPIV